MARVNWVEAEFAAIALVEPDPYSLWQAGAWMARCDHVWKLEPIRRDDAEFFRLPLRTICVKCRGEA